MGPSEWPSNSTGFHYAFPLVPLTPIRFPYISISYSLLKEIAIGMDETLWEFTALYGNL